MTSNQRRLSTLAALLAVILLDSTASRPASEETGVQKSRENSHDPRVGVGVASDPLRAAAPRPDEQRLAVYLPDQLMFRARAGQDAAVIAADHGLRLRREVGPSGVASVALDAAQDLLASLDALRADPRVAVADRVGAIAGAGSDHGHGHDDEDDDDDDEGSDDGSATSYSDLQWHLDAIGARDPDCAGCDPSLVTVAILDTGVAFEDHTRADGTAFVAASSLVDNHFVDPWDFVHGDAHPNDDHQHGTHIASLIASDGIVQGVAPGAAIMPLKVLDADDSGSEADLVDAITYAVDHGADIINMSLCFSAGYVPSSELREALQYAADSGVLMVAAAGNQGELSAVYPAASPLVISVGASTLDTSGDQALTDYSNTSPTLDLLAPGGNLDDDVDGDGYVDGILAETIDPADYSKTGLWFYAGTSQAAALVTGSLVWLVASGETDGARMRRALQAGSDGYGGFPYLLGEGAGDLDLPGALDMAAGHGSAVETVMAYDVAILPYLIRKSSKKVQPAVKLTAVDADGDPASSVWLVGTWWGTGDGTIYKCKTDTSGTCTLKGTAVSTKTTDAYAWGFSVDAAFSSRARNKGWLTTDRPGSVMFVTDGLVVMEEALSDAGLALGTPLALHWEETTDDTLGKLADSYAVVNGSVGDATRPEAVLATAGMLEPIATFTTITLDDYLTALGLSAYGDDLTLTIVEIDGSGIVSDPLGLIPMKLTLIQGLGIVSDPLGVRSGGLTFYTMGSGIVSDPLGFKGAPLQLSTGTLLSGSSLDGWVLGDVVESGGFVDDEGYPAASALMSSGAVGMTAADLSLSSGAMGGRAF